MDRNVYEEIVAAREKVDAAERDFKTELFGQNRFDIVALLKDSVDTANCQLENAHHTFRELVASRAVRAKPEMYVHPSSIEFWRSALDKSLSLRLGTVHQLPGDLFGNDHPVFVRGDYVELADNLLGHLNHFERPGIREAFAAHSVVYGTPGVGKSVFAAILVGFIGTYTPNPTVLYHAAFTPSADCFLGFFPDGSVRYISVQDAHVLMSRMGPSDDERLLWVVVDGKEPPEGTMATNWSRRLRTILVSSSNMEKHVWLDEWDKHVHLRLLMPPFT